MQPYVSIGMPVYNCEDSLMPAIRSLINQDYTNWELIIIDDGSKDNTIRLAKRFGDKRIRVFSDGQNLGLPERLNQAVGMGQGKYFARMDGDDIAFPDRLKIQANFLEKHPEVDLVGSRIIIFNGQGRPLGSYPFRQTHAEICRRPWSTLHLPHPTWMGKMDWFRSNPYRTDLKKAQDQELLLRTYEKSQFACLPDILLGYRKRSLSLKTILVGRFLFSRELLKKAFHEKQHFLAFGVVEHAMKAVIDTVAISTGLNYRILRHRAIPVGQGAESRWSEVWNNFNKDKDFL